MKVFQTKLITQLILAILLKSRYLQVTNLVGDGTSEVALIPSRLMKWLKHEKIGRPYWQLFNSVRITTSVQLDSVRFTAIIIFCAWKLEYPTMVLQTGVSQVFWIPAQIKILLNRFNKRLFSPTWNMKISFYSPIPPLQFCLAFANNAYQCCPCCNIVLGKEGVL